MPKIIFTQAEVNDYLQLKTNHFFRDTTIKLADDMAIHADGLFPLRLLRQRRPNEPIEVLRYREIIWTPITKPTFSKIYSSLQKIRRSRDWAIKYNDLTEFSKIIEQENIETYCEKEFPYFTSMTNWTFSIMLRKYLIDPNAVVFIMPIEFDVEQTGYLQPFPEIFNSAYVIDFRDDDYCVLENPTPITIRNAKGDEIQGKSYYFVTTQSIFRYDQIDGESNFKLVTNYDHGLGFLPAFKLGGILINQANRQFLYESRISGILPELDEAVREYSDLQAAKVLHIYPERWEFTNNECTNCKGTGKRHNPLWTENCNCEVTIECDKCHGHGYVVAGPYSKIMVKPTDSLNPGGQIPTPPAGYIQKDVEIIKIQQDGVDAHIFKALSSINFEFLAKTPLNQSGVAKEVDKDELNNTVHSIAEDIIAAMDKIYRAIAHYRYGGLYAADDIDNMLPDTIVPQVFDLLSAQHLEDELVLSRKNQANPIILNALEIDYAAKRFNDQDIRDMLTLTLELDPLPNQAEADKVLMLQNEGITKLIYIMSSNIENFVQTAIEEDEKFVEKTCAEQKAIIEKMAQDQIDKVSEAKAIVRSAFLANGGNGINGDASLLNVGDPLNKDNTLNNGNLLQSDYTANNALGQRISATGTIATAGVAG